MSKFFKPLAVISALAIFIAGFTSCKNNDDDDDNKTPAVNTGFEGKYFNVNVINKLKTGAYSENTIPYAQCSVEEIIFNSDGSGTYKIVYEEYDGEEGLSSTTIISEYIAYTKSDSSLKFKLTDYGELEFTIESDDKLSCNGRTYEKYEIEEIYAYVNMTGMSNDDTSSKKVTSKAILLGKDGSAIIRNIESVFESFAREPTIETNDIPGTYKKEGTSFTFTGKNTNTVITGTFSESDGRTYLKIGEEKYRKL
ncbi:MAG: hypothetical protein K5873_08445 [Treponema sp.]|nr:hypothetical protein [Treponema sp.]